MQLIECVPNFSEGRNLRTIEKISQEIADVERVHLLDVDSSASANRTVMTFVGEPEPVCEAAFRAIAAAQSLIDMRDQQGVHPRIGATDVCPLVPLGGASMDDCVELSNLLAARVAEELKIPIYLYAKSAKKPERSRLSFLRKGQYERLEKRMQEEDFHPDYGQNRFNAKSGATAIGARDLLIAFNINLATESRSVAEAIARDIRQTRQNQELSSALKHTEDEPCLLECTAIGWYIEEYKRAQVSMNIMDIKKTFLHQVFLEVKRLANQHQTTATGSEVVGLVPLQPLLEAGRFSFDSSKQKGAASDHNLVEASIAYLNLRDTRPFEANRKILDYRLKELSLIQLPG